MSCNNIHLYFERQVGNSWEAIAVPSDNHYFKGSGGRLRWPCRRDNLLFDKLAGQGLDSAWPFDPHCLARYLPPFTSRGVLEDWYGSIYHDNFYAPSWYSIEELESFEWPKRLLWFFYDYLYQWHRERKKVRMVFWFSDEEG